MACAGATSGSRQASEAPAAAASSSTVTLATAAADHVATRKRIQSILSIKTQRSPMDAFMALMKLESRAMPQALQSKELDPRFNPRCCCWDTASVPPAWTADTVCERCTLLNELLACARETSSSATLLGLVGTAVFVTNCRSEAQDSQGRPMPSLPTELVDLIVDYSSYEMIDTYAYTADAVCALLHTSSRIRLRLAQSFVPIELLDCSRPRDLHHEPLLMSMALLGFVWETASIHLNRDFTRERHDAHAPEPAAALPVLSVKDRKFFDAVECLVTLSVKGDYATEEEERTADDSFMAELVQTFSEDNVPSRRAVTEHDVCVLLRKVFQSEPLADFPRNVNLYMRALTEGSFEVPSVCLTVRVTLDFYRHPSVSSAASTRTFTFQSRK